MKSTISYVTGNPGKVWEVSRYIEAQVPDIHIEQANIDLVEPQDLDLKKIALAKATQAWEQIKKPLIVDDAGFFVEKYPNFPGFMSKFISLTIGMEGVMKLVQPGDRAFFRLFMVYMENPETYEFFEGRCDGSIATPTHEAHEGLPYDAIFSPDGSDKTYAEIKQIPGEDAKFAYRLKALQKFINSYKNKKEA
ncbi:hypothetical protein HOD08_01400 [bacterium]|nr:hypothetical protein [bacterium]